MEGIVVEVVEVVLVATAVVDVVFVVVVDIPAMVVEVDEGVVTTLCPSLNALLGVAADPPPPHATSIALNMKKAPQRKEDIGNEGIFIFAPDL